MSRGARVTLALASAFFGVLVCSVAPPTDKAPFFYGFGAFCLFIGLACVTRGRAARFCGSVVGAVVFLLGLTFLGHEVWGGPLWSGRRSEPSVLNACLFLFFFGLPGIAYAFRAKFGLVEDEPEPDSPPDDTAQGGPADRPDSPESMRSGA